MKRRDRSCTRRFEFPRLTVVPCELRHRRNVGGGDEEGAARQQGPLGSLFRLARRRRPLRTRPARGALACGLGSELLALLRLHISLVVRRRRLGLRPVRQSEVRRAGVVVDQASHVAERTRVEVAHGVTAPSFACEHAVVEAHHHRAIANLSILLLAQNATDRLDHDVALSDVRGAANTHAAERARVERTQRIVSGAAPLRRKRGASLDGEACAVGAKREAAAGVDVLVAQLRGSCVGREEDALVLRVLDPLSDHVLERQLALDAQQVHLRFVLVPEPVVEFADRCVRVIRVRVLVKVRSLRVFLVHLPAAILAGPRRIALLPEFSSVVCPLAPTNRVMMITRSGTCRHRCPASTVIAVSVVVAAVIVRIVTVVLAQVMVEFFFVCAWAVILPPAHAYSIPGRQPEHTRVWGRIHRSTAHPAGHPKSASSPPKPCQNRACAVLTYQLPV